MLQTVLKEREPKYYEGESFGTNSAMILTSAEEMTDFTAFNKEVLGTWSLFEYLYRNSLIWLFTATNLSDYDGITVNLLVTEKIDILTGDGKELVAFTNFSKTYAFS